MANPSPRPPAGVFVSLLVSIGLLGLFFMPWLSVSCNLQGAPNAAELRGIEGLPVELTKPTVLARATGWNLARGELTPDERFKAQADQDNSEGPPAKHWAWAGLVLPGLLAGLALLCICGRLGAGGAGKWMLLLGIGGVALMFVAASMDYVDEAMDQAKEQMASFGAPLGCRAFRQNMAIATDQAKKVIQTKTTAYLWGCLGMYVLIAGCGLAVMGAPEHVPAPESYAWQDGDEAIGANLGPGPAAPERETPAPAGLPDFGPPLTPREVPAPVGGDQADSQT
jgi:hypothetical protein